MFNSLLILYFLAAPVILMCVIRKPMNRWANSMWIRGQMTNDKRLVRAAINLHKMFS